MYKMYPTYNLYTYYTCVNCFFFRYSSPFWNKLIIIFLIGSSPARERYAILFNFSASRTPATADKINTVKSIQRYEPYGYNIDFDGFFLFFFLPNCEYSHSSVITFYAMARSPRWRFETAVSLSKTCWWMYFLLRFQNYFRRIG